MSATITPGILTVGIFDRYFRSYDPSLTHHQVLPPTFRYVDNCDDPALVDVALGTQDDWDTLRTHSKHPRRVGFLQETAEPRDWNRSAPVTMSGLELVLTGQRNLLALMPNSRWLTLIGTWVTDWSRAEKSKMVSFLARDHGIAHEQMYRCTGYDLRHEVAAMQPRLYDAYGTLFS